MSDPRFSIIQARAVYDDRLTHLDVRVLGVFGGRSNKQGWAHGNQGKIALRLKVARSSVNASIKRLVACGYLETQPQYYPNGGQRTNVYRVIHDLKEEPDFVDVFEDDTPPVSGDDTPRQPATQGRPAVAAKPKPTQDIGEGVSQQNRGVSRQPDRGVSSPRDTINVSSSLRSEEKNKRGALFDAEKRVDPRAVGFAELWKLWRAADAKDKAIRDRPVSLAAYKQLIAAGADAERIAAGTRLHCANPENTGANAGYLGKFSTFLESKAWDELADKALAERDQWFGLFVETGDWEEAKLGPKLGKVELERLRREWSERNQERAA